ncbi:ATP phosphoribosyltransferase regulatory subunit [Pseudoflavonifractor intestinihominis]|uniref:ATP phosphoribosyltransferase regulatory subunit n=1 Tax=Pseudoflavonifractor intestinihominis TaxID=3133171 RepID=A0ABV1E656_9FIRM|nr:ATP phosphoribosyltransferase regulatory subunit [uncultured Pseudoflavonifractor sp.]
MNYTVHTPEGTRDRLFAECRERRQVQQALTALFRRRSYAEIITPEVEFYDLFLQSGNPLPQEAMLKIIDRSGKIMVMRPDCTTPIARVAATKLRTVPLPQRLYYDQTVFRSGQEHRGGSSEIAQCGVELIGAGGKKADLEMVALAVDALKAAGLEQFHVELGHVGFFRELTARVDMPAAAAEQMRSLIEGKNFAALNDLLEPYDGQSAVRPLRRLPYLFGGAEVLDEADTLSGGSDALDYLRDLYGELKHAGYGEHIRFDLGLVHQIDYYTGVVFRGYVEGAGDAVLSGGRYDKLVGAFGRPAQATGFAVDVDAVAACLPAVSSAGLEMLIHYGDGEFARALAVLDARKPGSCELSPCRALESTLSLAREKGAPVVLVLENGGERMVEV